MIRRTVSMLMMLTALGISMYSVARAQEGPQAANPVPPSIRPDYNYSDSNSCTSCHFVMGAAGDHNLEAVGVKYDDTAKQFNFTGRGWLSSGHSQSNFVSTQNTYCAKCHSPLQATAGSAWKKGIFKNTVPVPDGQMEGVTCATCHPSHTAAAVLGRRLGIYQFGMDRNTPEAYKVIAQGAEDSLCMTCHLERHNVDNPVFSTMYQAGVRCIDCHQAVYGTVMNTTVPKREHDWKVAKNLPFSCGVEGSVVHCHPGFSVAGTLAFIPYIKQQHQGWPLPQGTSNKLARVNTQPTVADYTKLWQYLDAQARTQ